MCGIKAVTLDQGPSAILGLDLDKMDRQALQSSDQLEMHGCVVSHMFWSTSEPHGCEDSAWFGVTAQQVSIQRGGREAWSP